MPNTIDQQVVQMQFDNQQFEKNVKGSMSTIDKLKQSLNFTGVAKSFGNVNDAIRSVNMGGLGTAVDEVKARFGAMQVVAITALANITNGVVNAGKSLVSAFTIDPISQGFSEYETKMGSIQTIMSNTSSKGTTMDEVIGAIDDLNAYSDKTIYNFAEMTRNIGTFTAAGVGLQDSASAIKGIANLAASSGSNSQQASTAMYQLSQALASGKVQLMDWNSVVNAGMGGQKFQDALKQTARESGVAIDDIIKANGSFRDSLQEGWLTADILNKTLNNFTVDGAKKFAEAQMAAGEMTQEQADALIKEATAMEDAATKVKTFTQLMQTLKEAAQSGWGKTWEILVGNFEEAKDLFTQVSDTLGGLIGQSADSRNNLLQGWKDLGGRGQIIASIRNAFEGVMIVINNLSTAFKEIFPPITVEQLLNFSAGVQKMSEKLKLSEDNAAKLKDIFLGVFVVMSVGVNLIKALGFILEPLIDNFGFLAQKILDVTAVFGKWMQGLNLAIIHTSNFQVAIKRLRHTVAYAVHSIEEIFSKIDFEGIFGNIKNVVSKASDSITGGLNHISHTMNDTFGQLDFEEFIINIGNGVKELSDKFKMSDENVGKLKIAFDGFFAFISLGIKVFANFLEAISPVTAVISGMAGIVLQLAGILGQALLDIAASVGGWMISMDKGTSSMNQVGDSADIMKVRITKAFQDVSNNIEKTNFYKILGIIGDILGKIGTGIGEAMSSLGSTMVDGMANIDYDKLSAVLGTGILTAILVGIVKFVKNMQAPFEAFREIAEGIADTLTSVKDALKTWQMEINAKILMKIAIAVGILAASLFLLSGIEPKKLAMALGAMTIMLGELMGSMAIFAKMDPLGIGAMTSVTALIAISAAVLILAMAIRDIGALSWEEIAKGLTGVTVLLGELVLIVDYLATNELTIATGGVSLILLAFAVKILASAVNDLAGLSWEQLAKGLIGVSVILGALVLFCKGVEFTEGLFAAGAGMLLLAIGLKVIASAIIDMASLNWEQLATGLLGMAVSLGLVVAALNLMPDNSLALSAGLLLTAVAVRILAEALQVFGGMSLEEGARGLTFMGLALGELALALLLMEGTLLGSAALAVAAVSVALLAPALLLLSNVGWEGIAKSLIFLAGVFAIFGGAAILLTPAIPSMLALAIAIGLLGLGVAGLGAGLFLAGVGIQALAVGLGMLAGMTASSAKAVVEAIVTIVTGIVTLIPTVATALANGLIEFAKVMIDGAPVMADAFIAIVGSILNVIGTLIPQGVTLFFNFVVAICQALSTYIPILAQAALDLILGLLNAVATNIGLLIQAGVDIIVAFVQGIASAIPQLIDAGFQAVITFINGLAEAIRTNTQPMIDASNNLFGAIIDAGKAVLMNSVGGFMDLGKTIMESGLVKGVQEKVGGVFDAIFGGVQSALDAIGGFVKGFAQLGIDIATGFVDGIKAGMDYVWDAAKELGEGALFGSKDALDSNSPSKEYDKLGVDSDKGMANGLVRGLGLVTSAAKTAGETALDATSDAVSKLGDLMTNGIGDQPSIKPVLDLTNIQNGSSRLPSLFGKQSIDLAAQAQANTTRQSSALENVGEVVSATVKKLMDINDSKAKDPNANTTIEIPLHLDGKEVARATAPLINNMFGQMSLLSERGI